MDPNGLSINANALGSPSNSPPSSPRLAAVPSPRNALHNALPQISTTSSSTNAVVMHVANSLLSDLSETQVISVSIRQRWEKQEIARILGDVHRWSTDQNVNPDIQKARARIWETLSSQMTAWGL